MWINLLKDFKFNLQWGPWHKALADGILLFSPVEGHRCCGTWSKNGRDVEWNGWWQYLNANENEVGFGEWLNILYSRVVIWNHNLLPRVRLAARWGSRKQDQGTTALLDAILQTRQNWSIWGITNAYTSQDLVFYSFVPQYGDSEES